MYQIVLWIMIKDPSKQHIKIFDIVKSENVLFCDELLIVLVVDVCFILFRVQYRDEKFKQKQQSQAEKEREKQLQLEEREAVLEALREKVTTEKQDFHWANACFR